MVRFGSVSYTHLDVYKRQIHHRITKSDFKKLIMPEVSQGIEKNPKLDFLYVIDNETDTSFSVWFEDAIRKVQNICSWNKTCLLYTSRCV